MKLEYTRAMVKAALEGNLEKVSYCHHNLFRLMTPTSWSYALLSPGMYTTPGSDPDYWEIQNT